MTRRQFTSALGLGSLAIAGGCRNSGSGQELILACYEASRPLFRSLNRAFAEVEPELSLRPTFGGSSKQAQVVADGLEAVFVSLAVKPDIVHLVKKGLVDPDWEQRLPNRSLPYTSTIVFLTRKGNPFEIRDWPDLIAKPNMTVIASNPKTGGASRLAFLAAWGAVHLAGGSDADAESYLRSLYRRVPILDSSSRASLVTFGRKRMGDVLLTWENEAYLAKKEFGADVEIVHPPRSILAEPPIAVVDANARRLNVASAAERFARFLYSDAAQQIMANESYRPHSYVHPTLPALQSFRLDEVVPGGWDVAQQRFFSDGGVFDRIYQK